jgi:hypothetical protein
MAMQITSYEADLPAAPGRVTLNGRIVRATHDAGLGVLTVAAGEDPARQRPVELRVAL